jgi:hypothetical protein
MQVRKIETSYSEHFEQLVQKLIRDAGENNGGGRVLDGVDWDSVQSKLSSDVSGAETSWIGPITTKALHARLLCGIRFFDKNDRLIGNVPACAVKGTSRRTIAGRKRLRPKRTREARVRTIPCQLLQLHTVPMPHQSRTSLEIENDSDRPKALQDAVKKFIDRYLPSPTAFDRQETVNNL